MRIKIDDREFRASMAKLARVKGEKAEDQIADTLLMLSRREVPFDTSNLQKSGFTDRDKDGIDGAFVCYNEEYAAYQHEGMRKDGSFRVRNRKNGRKAKYLEDPMKQNISTWGKIALKFIKEEVKKNV